jgi:hypothetical protein
MLPSPRWLGCAQALCLAALGCTGDADLGAERAPLDATPALRDAGKPNVVEPSHSDATTLPGPTDAGTTPLALDFRVGGASVTQLRVACPDPCFVVDLAAHGGTPPYTFSWSDASTDAQRRLCPESDTTLRAVVSDAHGGSRSSTLDVGVTPCSISQLCATNPSFEGSPAFGSAWLDQGPLDAAPWEDCRATNPETRTLPKIVASASGDEFPQPSDRASYLYLESAANSHQSVGQTLCAPLQVGSLYSFKLDLARAGEDDLGARLSTVQVEIHAAASACQRDELLWTSPRLGTGWRTFCLTLKPTKPATALLLSAFGPGPEASAVFIDHLVPVDGCP